MEQLQAHELDSRHFGEEVVVPLVWRADGRAAEVERGELLAVDHYVGNVVLTIGKGAAREPITLDVPPDTEVRVFPY